ncbi:DNA translocase FtsK 4TM domain-containing protein [Pseudorhodobacter sp.]|uniref:DNA translocase FtsK n=1 Tax=Pseudorhodobacter sp. TaxID=1934400 RepID=UPI00264890DA|nr:DNA translocase FtsK 4TM domain-containing protein [Pseudorhodobacter sp.]MDN5786385.1 DNA translocase FtsK 4TM domain-containing protein [Pseudorhodobacter sp.]
MASYQVRQRDPLVDQNTAAMLERRGRELLGAGLVVLALFFIAILGSYSANDPGWMVATDAPVHNWMGRFGASVASTLFIIGGLGSWGIPLIVGAWGIRFVGHLGEDRALGRVVFAVIAVALASVFAATHVPGPNWPHAAIGLGGLFGDTVLGALLAILPVGTEFGLKLLSVCFGFGLVGMGLFVTGFDMPELRAIARFVRYGTVAAYATALSLAGKSAAGTARAATAMAEKNRARREIAAQNKHAAYAYDDVIHDAPMQPAPLRADRSVGVSGGFGRPESFRKTARHAAEPPIHAAPEAALVSPRSSGLHAPDRTVGKAAEKPGLLARVPMMIRRAATHQAEEEVVDDVSATYLPSEDRIKARINDVIRSRVRQPVGQPVTVQSAVQAAIARREPPVMGRRGPVPLIATRRNVAPIALPAEPPVIATAAPQPRLSLQSASRTVLPAAPQTGWQAEAANTGYSDADTQWEQDFQAGYANGDAAHFARDDDDYSDDVTEFGIDEDSMPEPQIIRVSAPVGHATALDARRLVQPASKKPMAPSRQALAEAQPRLKFEEKPIEFDLPPLGLLSSPDTVQRHTLSEDALEENARMLESVLDDYGVKGEIVAVRPGPVVTQYELEPAPGLKASRVIGLADDIARSMSALSARVSTVPGRSVIGIELPNAWREKVVLREILAARDFGDSNMRLPLALGKDIAGEPIVANLAKMPHLLIAGTTGSGKSVAINTMILSLLYKLTPDECRMIMIDPKMLELSVYDGIPHLLSPVVTDPKKAVVALKWVVGEMEERYRKMSKMGVRNIEGFNGRVREALAKNEMFKRTIQTGFDEDTGEPVFETEEFAPVSLPYIVVIVDEMADLMMVAGKEIEACIQRLAQMARASGIHLIMATQRPSVDVITGTIKANFPTRISFQVTSKIDSRTILGEMGAEQLLGMGDMLYMAGGAKITRIHGPFVSDEEVEEVVNHLKSYGPPSYMSGVVEGVDDEKADDIDLVLGLGGGEGGDDALYDQAVAVVAKDRKCSTSYIQRKLGIGYNKAAKLVEQMEENSVVSTANHVGKREILLPEH